MRYSQGGQDDIIKGIFDKVGTTNKFCVEFGFNSWTLDGGSGANVARLVLEEGWKCLLLDNEHENPEIGLYKEHLTRENIASAFRKYQAPGQPDYVSIDVDGDDLWLLKGMLEADFLPRLISVEYNARFPLYISATMKPGSPKWEMDAAYGASLAALTNVAEEYGYVLVAVEDGLDAFFLGVDIEFDAPRYSSFERFTDHYVHPVPARERQNLFVQYPSLEPLLELPASWKS